MPAVSLATAAPAHAATSTGGLRLLVNATYSWMALPTRTSYSVVVPAINIANPTSVASGQVVVTLHFPISDFTGIFAGPHGEPPLPGYFNTGSLQPWSRVPLGLPKTGDTEVLVAYTNGALGIGAGQTGTLGGPAGPNAYGVIFANPPLADVLMSVHASATGFVDAAGVMTPSTP
ncbi:MAG: hypothetical protein QM747_11915 [Nocardioides sp.]